MSNYKNIKLSNSTYRKVKHIQFYLESKHNTSISLGKVMEYAVNNFISFLKNEQEKEVMEEA